MRGHDEKQLSAQFQVLVRYSQVPKTKSVLWGHTCKLYTSLNSDFKEPLSWIFENDCSYGVEYSSKGMKTSC